MTTIKLKNGSGAPATSDLVQGEPALDLTNKRLYTENASGAVIEIGTSPSTIDINAGTIDGTVIGGASAAALTATTITGTNITANSTITVNNDGGSSFSQSRIILDSNGANRAAGIFSHNQVNDTEWFFGNPYDTPDSFAINRQATASHNDSTSNKTNSLVTVSSSGDVGIGTTSPSFNSGSGLEISRANTCTLRVENTGTGASSAEFFAGNAKTVIGSTSNTHTEFRTNSIERMRIDTSGRVLVGKTSSSITTAGGEVTGGSLLQSASSTSTNLATNSGAVINLCNTSATDGNFSNIGGYNSNGLVVSQMNFINLSHSSRTGAITFSTHSGSALNEAMRIDSSGNAFFYANGGELRFTGHSFYRPGAFGSGIHLSTDRVLPANENGSVSDNTEDLGSTTYRWNDAYITNGVTTGSDERYKQDISALSEAETRVAVACKSLLRKWRWKDRVEAKDNNPDSDEVARFHFGIVAQELKAAFEAEGLDAGRYGMFMHDTWTDEETGEERDRMGVRYSELLAFIIAAI